MHEIPNELYDLLKLVLIGSVAIIFRDFNVKLNKLMEKVDKLVEAQMKNDVRFEHNGVTIAQNAKDITDVRKSISTLWDNVRRHESFNRAIKSLHNSIHPDKKINGDD